MSLICCCFQNTYPLWNWYCLIFFKINLHLSLNYWFASRFMIDSYSKTPLVSANFTCDSVLIDFYFLIYDGCQCILCRISKKTDFTWLEITNSSIFSIPDIRHVYECWIWLTIFVAGSHSIFDFILELMCCYLLQFNNDLTKLQITNKFSDL